MSQKTGKSISESKLPDFVSYVVATAAAFLGTAPFYAATRGFVYEYAFSHYGSTSASAAMFIWGGLCALLIFGTAKSLFYWGTRSLLLFAMIRFR